MGKQKRQRQKFHVSPNSKVTVKDNDADAESFQNKESQSLMIPPNNLFGRLNIDFGNLNEKLADDVLSVKSFKSVKSEFDNNTLSKKEKIKLRREILLKKIDTINQLKKETKARNKRKNVTIMGDTNPLHDALPSLESLLVKTGKGAKTREQPKKVKGIEKAKMRKKELMNGVQIYKRILSNKSFKENPLVKISEHVKSVVEKEKSKMK